MLKKYFSKLSTR